MNTLDAIRARRSIRRFREKSVEREKIETILEATIQAPSAKNGQPWRFVVLEGEQNRKLAQMMLDQAAKLKELGWDIGSLEWTAKAMMPAGATIVVFNAEIPGVVPEEAHDSYDFVMLQSTGGAIQTMLLAATDLGLGSLWICDILYCYEEVKSWLGREAETLVACVTLGYADESPGPRPRKPWQEITDWRGSPA